MEATARPPQDGVRNKGVLSLVARDLTQLFGSEEEVDWERPTPCTDWTLRDLTEHVIGGNRFTIRILGGDTAEDALAATRRSFDGDDDTARSLVTSTHELEACLVAPGALDRMCHHVNGELPGRDVLRLRLHDLIIHTWDAAEALQAAPVEIRPELVDWALADIATDALAGRHFGIDLPLASDARPDQEVLLAAFGRRATTGRLGS